jgi:alkyl hydroperoxide reductase subunit AhpC
MSDSCDCIGCNVGSDVPDFTLEIYDSSKSSFGEISLKALKKSKKWTILFFYPADFTFV